MTIVINNILISLILSHNECVLVGLSSHHVLSLVTVFIILVYLFLSFLYGENGLCNSRTVTVDNRFYHSFPLGMCVFILFNIIGDPLVQPS